MANKFLSGINVTGITTLNTVANAGTDTDKFLVLDASGNVDFRTGDELYADLGIGSLPAGFTSTVKHAVKAGVALTKGQAVYVTGADGTNMIVGKASNASEATSSKTMGLIETALSINGIGNVITEGLLTGLDTTGATAAGDPVWLGTDGNLIYGLTNKPYAPAHLVFIGIVTRRNANNGEIFVKVQNGFELKEIHDVDLITTTPVNGHILGYNGTLWVNKTIAGWLGYTPADAANYVPYTGATSPVDLGVNNILSSGAINATGNGGGGVINIAINSSRTVQGNGYVSLFADTASFGFVDWISANTRAAKFSLASISNNSTVTLTIPNSSGTIALTSNLSAYVPTSRTITINGVAYDLSANREWTIEAGGSSASTRTIQKFTSTASQTTFTITGGYTVGMVDVWVNGVKLDNAVDFTASNGTTVVLTDALTASQIVEVYKYGSQFIINNGLRQKTLFTATAAQTTFTVAYSVGLVDVYYNGSKLDDSDFTATNGTSIVLGTACAVNDKVEVIAFSYNVNGFTGIGGSGTINNLPKFTAAGTIGDSAITDNGTTVTLVSRALAGTSATFSSSVTATQLNASISTSGAVASVPNLAYFKNQGSGFVARIAIGDGTTSDSYISHTGGNTTATQLLGFGVNAYNQMVLTAAGNLAIGTTSVIDSNKLMVLMNDATNGTGIGIRAVNDGGGASQPALSYFNGSGNLIAKIVADNGTGYLGFNVGSGNTERMRITSGGTISVGGFTPTEIASGYKGIQLNDVAGALIAGSSYSIYATSNATISSSGWIRGGAAYGAGRYSQFDGGHFFYSAGTGSAGSVISWSEQMRITSGGNLLVGTSNDVGQRLRVYQPTSGNWNIKLIQPNGSDQKFVEFITTTDGDASNTARGSITYNGTNVLFNGTSDYRLKEDLKDFNGLNIINQLKTYDFNWVEADKRDYGMMAHELQEILPNYVTGEKDAINEDGSIKAQGVDYSKIVPILVKAIQELSSEVTELKALIAAK